jgi:hypothetical protein
MRLRQQQIRAAALPLPAATPRSPSDIADQTFHAIVPEFIAKRGDLACQIWFALVNLAKLLLNLAVIYLLAYILERDDLIPVRPRCCSGALSTS